MIVEQKQISELTKDPANARKHSKRNIKAIKDSLRVYGQQKPIVIDNRNVVIAGNGTVEAAEELGWETVFVTVSQLEPALSVGYGIADNRTAELAEWDDDALNALVENMDEELAAALHIDDIQLTMPDEGQESESFQDTMTHEDTPRFVKCPHCDCSFNMRDV